MLISIYHFILHLLTWILLYIIPLIGILILILIGSIFIKNFISSETKGNERKRKELSRSEKNESILNLTIQIKFIFKAFFYGLILSATVLIVYLWIYEF